MALEERESFESFVQRVCIKRGPAPPRKVWAFPPTMCTSYRVEILPKPVVLNIYFQQRREVTIQVYEAAAFDNNINWILDWVTSPLFKNVTAEQCYALMMHACHHAPLLIWVLLERFASSVIPVSWEFLVLDVLHLRDDDNAGSIVFAEWFGAPGMPFKEEQRMAMFTLYCNPVVHAYAVSVKVHNSPRGYKLFGQLLYSIQQNDHMVVSGILSHGTWLQVMPSQMLTGVRLRTQFTTPTPNSPTGTGSVGFYGLLGHCDLRTLRVVLQSYSLCILVIRYLEWNLQASLDGDITDRGLMRAVYIITEQDRWYPSSRSLNPVYDEERLTHQSTICNEFTYARWSVYPEAVMTEAMGVQYTQTVQSLLAAGGLSPDVVGIVVDFIYTTICVDFQDRITKKHRREIARISETMHNTRYQ